MSCHLADASLLPPGQTSRLVATAGLSFTRDTREDFPTLQPPDSDAYLANIAVDVRQRRRGHARRMLAAVEALTVQKGFSRLYLHVRLNDQAAQQLYASGGYQEVERDQAFLARMRGITPRALLYKQL
jgi:ribosomal protein S18 acetylase RimI-like enzyme